MRVIFKHFHDLVEFSEIESFPEFSVCHRIIFGLHVHGRNLVAEVELVRKE